jgi:hypothetical protein
MNGRYLVWLLIASMGVPWEEKLTRIRHHDDSKSHFFKRPQVLAYRIAWLLEPRMDDPANQDSAIVSPQ